MKNGFTLIETILYLALFSIIIGGGMVAAYQIIQATDAGNNHIILQEEANFLLRKIDWALTGATDAHATASTLTITKPIAGIPTQLIFSVANGVITLKRGTNVPEPLNASSILVSASTFTPTSATFTLTTAQNGRATSQTFSTTKYARK